MDAGATVKEACAAAGLTEPTYYRWRAARHGGDAPVRRDIARVRNSIDTAAKDVFLRVGYSASIDEIADAAEVSRQTIYNLYGDKAGLFRAIVRKLYEDLHIITHVSEAGSLDETIHDFARRYVDSVFDPDAVSLSRVLIMDREAFPDLARDLAPLGLQRTQKALEDYFAGLVAAGRMYPCDPRLASEAFIGALRGHARQRMLLGIDRGPGDAERAAIARHATDWFMRGMAREN